MKMTNRHILLCALLLAGAVSTAEERPYSVATLPTWNNHGHNVQWNYIFKNAGWAYTNIMESAAEMDWLVKNFLIIRLLIIIFFTPIHIHRRTTIFT